MQRFLTPLEENIEFEDELRKEVKSRFPSLDPDWAVNKYQERMHNDSRKMAKALVLMMPEVIRVKRQGEK